MGKVYDWMAKHPDAARVWIIAIIVAMIVILTVPVLFIPGFLKNIKSLYGQNPTLFFLFVVIPGVVTTTCSLIWGIGNAWEKLGDALNIGKDGEVAD